MTIARVSRGGRSEDLQSLEATTESERHDKDELENDADHKELVSTYGCEDYLLRWLPNIGNHDHVSHAATKPSQCEERRDKEEHATTPVPPETFLKSTSRYHQTKETDVYISSGNKIFRETGRLTYFEAIKCSPMKLRQSITTHKRPNVSSLIVSQQHSQKPVKERVPTSKNRSPVFEITQHPVRQLGSLQTKNSVRRPSQATYSSIRLGGGKISTSRRNAHYKTPARKGSELRVRCESVMIYPKALIPPGNEKPSKKPTKPRKEAWRETSSVPAAVQSDEDCTKLPHLGAKKSEPSEDKQNQKLSPELEGNSKAEKEQKQSFQSSSNRSASMKIVIPFGEDQEPHETVEGFGKPLRPATLKQEVLERKSSQATSKVYNEQNSRKKGEHFYDNQKEYRPNSPEKSRRITSMVITQLGTPRKTLCNNPSFTSATPNVPLSKIRTGTTDTNGLFLGRENLLQQRAGARFSYNQRSRAADLGIQNKDRVLPERLDHEGGKCFLSTESGGSLTIGGTGLLRKQRRLHENFGKGEEIKDTGEQPGYFRNSLLHSHYIM